ncbi:MAG: hypothetical protein HFH68_06015 [Lachnospiraceae bacterium]|nr:hypothetical protein [Lachnospiraceae bacterium]
MKKKWIVSIIILFIFVIFVINIKNRIEDKADIQNVNTDKNEEVYFKELYTKSDIQKFRYDEEGFYPYSLLYYNGKIYTSDNTINCNIVDNKPDIKELSKVYGNSAFCWSEDSNMLLEVTEEGTIYEADGYSDDYRICLYYKETNAESNKSCYIKKYFDCFNGMYLSYGRDLFKDILHLENTEKIYIGDDREISNTRWTEVLDKDINFKEFYNALCNSRILQPEVIEKIYSYYILDGGCVLQLEDKNGVKTILEIYLDGYVVFKSSDKQHFFIVKINEEYCSQIYSNLK